jgi:hypothetical protein
MDALLPSYAPEFVSPPPLGPYYELPSDMLSPNAQRAYFVPVANVVKADFASGRPAWMDAEPGATAGLRAALPEFEPWPAPMISAAFVGANRAADPKPYGALFDRFPPAPAPPATTNRLSISLRSALPSPWTDGYNNLEYVPGRHLLHRGSAWVRLPGALAERIERDAGLLPPASGSGLPWMVLAALAGGFLLVGGASLFVVRNARRRPRARAA